METTSNTWKIQIKPWAQNKWLLRACLALAAAATIFFLCLWIISFDYALIKCAEKLQLSTIPLLKHPKIISAISPELNNSIKSYFEYDLSTITFFLLFIFSLHVFLGVRSIFQKKLYAAMLTEFPFSPRYRITWVQWGLIGTLWGFLLLGFGLIGLEEEVAADSELATISLLVQAFGTALLSTFSAVVLAYMGAPFFQWLFSICISYPPRAKSNDKVSADFVHYLQAVNTELRQMVNTLDANKGVLMENLKVVNSTVQNFNRSIERAINSAEGPLAKINSSIEYYKQPLSGIKEFLEKEHKSNLKELIEIGGNNEKQLIAIKTQQRTNSEEIKNSIKEVQGNHKRHEMIEEKIEQSLSNIANYIKSFSDATPKIAETIMNVEKDLREVKQNMIRQRGIANRRSQLNGGFRKLFGRFFLKNG